MSKHVKWTKGTTLGAFYSAGGDCLRYNPDAAIAKVLDGKKKQNKSPSPKKKKKKKQNKLPSPKKKQKQPSIRSPASTITASSTDICPAVTSPPSPRTKPSFDISPLSCSMEPFFDEDIIREAKIVETKQVLRELGKEPEDSGALRSVELL